MTAVAPAISTPPPAPPAPSTSPSSSRPNAPAPSSTAATINANMGPASGPAPSTSGSTSPVEIPTDKAAKKDADKDGAKKNANNDKGHDWEKYMGLSNDQVLGLQRQLLADPRIQQELSQLKPGQFLILNEGKPWKKDDQHAGPFNRGEVMLNQSGLWVGDKRGFAKAYDLQPDKNGNISYPGFERAFQAPPPGTNDIVKRFADGELKVKLKTDDQGLVHAQVKQIYHGGLGNLGGILGVISTVAAFIPGVNAIAAPLAIATNLANAANSIANGDALGALASAGSLAGGVFGGLGGALGNGALKVAGSALGDVARVAGTVNGFKNAVESGDVGAIVGAALGTVGDAAGALGKGTLADAAQLGADLARGASGAVNGDLAAAIGGFGGAAQDLVRLGLVPNPSTSTAAPAGQAGQAPAGEGQAPAGAIPSAPPLLVSPELQGTGAGGGVPAADAAPATTVPPAAIDALFASGRPVQTQAADGRVVTFNTPEEYRAYVAANRAASGVEGGGDLLGVQLNLEGGGGKGKRYGAALGELFDQGIVPTSVAGASAGAITAALVAAGADPATLQGIARDPALSGLIDVNLASIDGGLLDGQRLYDFVDQKLRDVTGITDRPVTFRDLNIPLQVLATRASDSLAPEGSLGDVESRRFVFSQETTPDTAVALAVRASAAIPGVFDPVRAVDPASGRELLLVDGGVIDNLPSTLGNPQNRLPVLGITLSEPGSNNPNAAVNRTPAGDLPAGNLAVTDLLTNIRSGLRLNERSGQQADDFNDRANPLPGQFQLSIPIFDLTDPLRTDSTLGLAFDPDVDPALDVQTRDVTRSFVRQLFDGLARGTGATNISTELPADLRFERPVTLNGQSFTAIYSGGDSIRFRRNGGGDAFDLPLGRTAIEGLYLDDLAFGSLAAELEAVARMAGLERLKRVIVP